MASRAGMLGSVVEAEEGGRWGKTTGVCRGNAAISTPSRPWQQVASRPWTESQTQVCPPRGLSWAAGLLVQEKWSVCTLVPCRGVEEAKARRLTHGRPLTSDRRVPPVPVSRRNRNPQQTDPPTVYSGEWPSGEHERTRPVHIISETTRKVRLEAGTKKLWRGTRETFEICEW